MAVFFVLSGYLIGGQLVEEQPPQRGDLPGRFLLQADHADLDAVFHRPGWNDRAVRRPGAELGPGVLLADFSATTYTYNLLNDLRGSIHPIWVSFNQIWSLSIEEQFYLVVPLILGWIPLRSIVPVSLLLAAALLAWLPLYAGLFLGVLLAAAIAAANRSRLARGGDGVALDRIPRRFWPAICRRANGHPGRLLGDLRIVGRGRARGQLSAAASPLVRSASVLGLDDLFLLSDSRTACLLPGSDGPG